MHTSKEELQKTGRSIQKVSVKKSGGVWNAGIYARLSVDE